MTLPEPSITTSLVFSFVAKLVSNIFCDYNPICELIWNHYEHFTLLSAHKAAEKQDDDPPLRFEYDKLTNYLKAEWLCLLSVPYGFSVDFRF